MDKTILETINNLRTSGLGNNEIKSMLMDIGFDEATINEAMGSETNAEKDTAPEEVSEQTLKVQEIHDKAKEHATDAKLASNLAMNIAQSTSNKVDQHLQKVNTFEDRLDGLEDSISSLPTKDHINEIKELHTDLHTKHDDLSERIDTIEAKLDGLTKIMKDILENQRDILMRLK